MVNPRLLENEKTVFEPIGLEKQDDKVYLFDDRYKEYSSDEGKTVWTGWVATDEEYVLSLDELR